MSSENLTAEQWQAIAEKLAKYMGEMCEAIDNCDGCPFKYADSCEFIEQAKRSLDMNKENELCPFCKNKFLYVIGINNDIDCEQQKILCADCGATGPFADSAEEAWEKWNKRKSEDEM